MLLLKLFYFLLVVKCSEVDIIKFSIMQSYASQSFPKYHSLFHNKNTCAETETKLDFISFIWDDDHIVRIYENNWQFTWCNTIPQ